MDETISSRNLKLYEHQEKAVRFILERKSGAIFHEVGCGKTLTALTLYKRLGGRLLVVCPISLINAAWKSEIEKWFGFKVCNLRDKYIEDADVYIVNYESFKKKMHLIKNINVCILDESAKIRNPKAQITKTLLSCRDWFNHRIILSGTPAPNSEDEFWSQIKFSSGIFPDSYYAFRNTYFTLSRGSHEFSGYADRRTMQEMFKRGFRYTVKGSKRKELLEKVNSVSHWAKKKDCLDLPDQVDEVREVELSAFQMRHYKDMKDQLITNIKGKEIAAQIALTRLMKLRQICSGFAIDENSEARDLQDNTKLKELLDLLQEIGDKQVIIWVQFHREVEHIMSRLNNAEALYSKTKDRDEVIEGFRNGRFQYLVAHPRSGGHGITWVNCSDCIYYSLDYSYEAHEQSRGRIHRPGQVNKCTYYYLTAKGTIDEQIMLALRKKQSLQEIFDSVIRT